MMQQEAVSCFGNESKGNGGVESVEGMEEWRALETGGNSPEAFKLCPALPNKNSQGNPAQQATVKLE